jgi:competence protein ComEA
VVGAAVVIGIICLGSMLVRWTVHVHPAAADSLAARVAPDSTAALLVAVPPVLPRAQRTQALPPASFQNDPLSYLSHAPADSLDLLPGIGPVLAGRIVDARRARGGFSSWKEVLDVKGVGPRLVARWQSLSARQ